MPTKVIIDVFLIKDGSKMSRWFIITFLAEAMRSVFPTWWSNDNCLQFKYYGNNASQEYNIYWATFWMSPNYCKNRQSWQHCSKSSLFQFCIKKVWVCFSAKKFSEKIYCNKKLWKIQIAQLKPLNLAGVFQWILWWISSLF